MSPRVRWSPRSRSVLISYPAPDWPWYFWWVLVWFVGIAGAVLPDVPYAAYMVYHKIRGTPVEEYAYNQGPLIMNAKEMSHSFVVWGILFSIAWYLIPIVTPVYPADLSILELFRSLALVFTSAGILGGVLLDLPTHVGSQYKKDDCTFLWGLGLLVGDRTLRPDPEVHEGDGRVTRWVKQHLLAEYRIAPSVLWPLKRFEKNYNVLVLTGIVALWDYSLILLMLR